jgi:EpsI family protein
MKFLLVALAFLGLNFYIYHFLATDEVHPSRVEFASFPTKIGEWECREKAVMDPDSERVLGVTDYLLCDFVNLEERALIGVYAGYHQSQARKAGGGNDKLIHPPKHCLPGSGWDIIGAKQLALDIPGMPEYPAVVNRFVVAKGEQRQLVYYWYQSRGRIIASDWKKIVYLFLDRARTNRTDGSLIRFSIPLPPGSPEEESDQRIMDLASELVPLLSDYIPE